MRRSIGIDGLRFLLAHFGGAFVFLAGFAGFEGSCGFLVPIFVFATYGCGDEKLKCLERCW